MISTRDKIVTFLSNSPNNAAIKRDILMRMSYREDFKQVYQDMLTDGTIEEYSYGTRNNPRMVCLSFKAIQMLPKKEDTPPNS